MSDPNLSIVPYEGMEVAFDTAGNPWMSQNQIAELLGISRQNVGNMISFAFENGDLEENSVRNLRLQAGDGKMYNVKHYDFDAILLVGFRSKASNKALAFRRWVSAIVLDHISNLQERNENLQIALEQEQMAKDLAEWESEKAQRELNDHILIDIMDRYPEEFE